MIAMKICYPRVEGMRFDMDYYINGHLATSNELAAGACKGMLVEIPEDPDSNYAVVGTLFYESEQAYHDALDQHSKRLLEDIANFTDVTPDICFVDITAAQVPEVRYTG